MVRLVPRAFAATVALLAAGFSPATASADPVLVFPGMEIRQDNHVCTLGYVDPALKIAFTAGHCRGGGAVTSRDYKVIGHLRAFRDNTLNRPGMSGDSSSWKGWGHVRWFIEEVPAGAA